MLGNLYMLPFIIHEPVEALDIWHSSNRDHPDYLFEVEEFLNEPKAEEREWIKREYNSHSFFTLREEYINTYRQLKYEHDIQKRGDILNAWRRFSSRYFENHG